MRLFSTIAFLLCFVSATIAQIPYHTHTFIVDPEAVPREHNVDFTHMKLDVSFVPTEGLVKGKLEHTFTVIRPKVDSIVLDGVDIRYSSIMLDGKKADHIKTNDKLTILPKTSLAWDSEHTLTIEYECNPRSGIYFIGWNDPNNLSRKQIWTQGQGIDNRHWIPCYDTQNDKLITEVTVKFDKEYKVLSNGTKLAEKDNGDGTKTWHYKMQHPHPTYLVMLGIGRYDIEKRKSASGVPIDLWYYPEWKDRVKPSYKYSVEMFDFFEKEIGVPYGWESYSQIPVQDFMYGAMENTTATLFGDFFFVDNNGYLDRNYVAVNAHELAHQWFGDLVTAKSIKHHWLQESFATHYNLLYEREAFGQDHFDWRRRGSAVDALNASKTDLKPIANSTAGSPRHYPKGALVLDMMKYVTSREEYNRAVKHYLEAHKYQNVDSEDLMEAFLETTGRPMDWFWEQWVYRGGEPDYKVSYEDLGDKTRFTVTQQHAVSDVVGLFKMPFVFEVHYKDGSMDTKTAWIENKTHAVDVDNPAKKAIDYVLFDPNSRVALKTVSFVKPQEMLKAQAAKAKYMLDRYDAVVALRSASMDDKIYLYKEIMGKKNEYHPVKGEIVYQLANVNDSRAQEIIKMAISDEAVQVRQSVVNDIKFIDESMLADFEKLLDDKSYVTIEKALEKLCLQYPANSQKYLTKTQGIDGYRGNNVKVKWLEMAAANDPKYKDQLVELTSVSYEFLTRNNAMEALKRLNYFNETLLKNLVDASFNPNRRLAGPAKEAINHFYYQNTYKKQISEYLRNGDWNDWEQKIVDSIL